MTHTPRITILTPTYNRAALLDLTIQSVLAQTYPHIEYIVLDDGSTDATRTLLKRYEGRLQWVTHPNQGEAKTVNRGLAMATGDLIGVINSDDPVMPDLVERIVAAADRGLDALVYYPDWIKIDGGGAPISPVMEREYDYRRMLLDGICLVGPGAFFRREALALVGERDERYRFVGDFDFWLRLGLHGRFQRVAQPLATHRVHGDSATVAGRGSEVADEMITMLTRLFATPAMPADLRALQRRSLANMHYLAGAQSLQDDYPRARRSFREAFWGDPGRMIRQPSRLLQVAAAHLIPSPLHRRLYQRWQTHKAERERAVAQP